MLCNMWKVTVIKHIHIKKKKEEEEEESAPINN
jgi:hypothetical protein